MVFVQILIALKLDVLDEMVSEACKEILSNGFGSNMFKDDDSKKFSSSQLWQTIRLLSETSGNKVPSNDLLYSIFRGNKTPLKALVNSNILAVENQSSSDGKVVQYFKPFSPLYTAAFLVYFIFFNFFNFRNFLWIKNLHQI